MRRKKSRSWFFIWGQLWPANLKERRFFVGLITGAATVTLFIILLLFSFQPNIEGELRGVKRIGQDICSDDSCFIYPLTVIPRAGCAPDQKSACVSVQLAVAPSRRVIVDEQENILKIFSNTGLEYSDFKIFAAYQDVGGKEFPLTKKIQEQYQILENQIDWQERGLVYEYDPKLVYKVSNLYKNLQEKTEEVGRVIKITYSAVVFSKRLIYSYIISTVDTKKFVLGRLLFG